MMPSYIWRILLVDDDEDDYFLTRSMLSEARQGKFQLEWASSFEQGREALRDPSYDAVLMDYDMGARSGIELIREAIAAGCTTPIILLTGRGTYEMDVEAMQAGAMDYLNKAESSPALLERSIRYAIERKRSELERAEANRALAETNASVEASRLELSEIIESISDGFFSLDRGWRFIYINSRAARSTGREPADLIGKNVWQEYPRLVGTSLEQRYRQVMEQRQPMHFEWQSVSGPPIWFEVNVYPSAHGISVHWVDITEKKSTAQSLQESQELLRQNQDLFALWIEANASTFWSLGPGGEMLEPQPGYQSATGLSWENCQGWGWLEAVHPEDREALREKWQQAIVQPGAIHHELRLWNAAGQQYRWYLLHSVPHFATDGSLLAWIGAAIDNQERKQVEQNLQRERELLQKLFARIPVMIDIYRPADRFHQLNTAFEQLTGWSADEASQVDLMERCYPDPNYRKEVVDFMSRPDSGWRDFFLTTRSGELLECSWTNLRLSDDTHIGIGIDIREQKLAEQALLEVNALLQQQKRELEIKNQQLEGLFKNAPASMVLFDAQPPYRVQTYNQIYQELKPEQYRSSDIAGLTLQDLIPRAAEDGVLEIFDEVASTGSARTLFAFPIDGLAGGRTWWNWTLAPVIVEGQVVALAHIAVNISDEIRARHELEAERAFLQAVLDQLPVAVVIIDAQDGSMMLGNQQVEKTWRRALDRAQGAGVPWEYQGFYPDGRAYEPHEQPMARALRGEVVRDEEVVILRGDGTYGVLQVDAAPVRSARGEIQASVSVFLDITERKRSERDTLFLIEMSSIFSQVSDPEELLAKISEMVGVHLDCTRSMFSEVDSQRALIIIHRDFHLGLQSSAGVFPLTNTSPEITAELETGRPVVNRDTQLDPRTANRYETFYAKAGIRSYIAVPLVRAGSLAASLLVSDSRPRNWNDRQVTFIQSVAERTWATYETGRLLVALRENEERFRLASRAIEGYIYDYDLATGRVLRSEGFERLTGFTREEMADYSSAWIERVHPEDREIQTNRAILTAAQEQGIFSNEFRFQRADGTWLTLYEQGMLIRDAAGSPVRLVGITTDITRRKQMEETLRQSEANMRASEEKALRLAEQAQLNLQMLETVIDSMKEGVMLCDMQGELVRANPAAVTMHGFASEDQMLRQINQSLEMFELHSPDGRPIHSNEWPLARTVREGSVINQELHVRRTDTGKSWIGLYSATTVRNRPGKGLLILKTAVDITQIRQAEQQRRELDMMLKVQHLLVAQREQERLQIARDLHDGPIQDLISLRFTIQSALTMTGDKDLVEILNAVQDEAQKLVTALRGVCNELRPPVLSKFGLAKAILAHTEELQGRSGAPRIELALDDDSGRLTDEARLSLYRIYQESLNNILRHANARHASVRLQMMPDHLLLDIQDDGAGFDLPADWLLLAQQGHLGLVGIKERTEAIGGSVEITSAPGRGTRVLVILPLGHR